MFVSVSTMPAGDDVENVKKYAKEIENFADFLHCDICDGEYNQTTCFSPKIAVEINKISTVPLDCHLMTKNAVFWANKYIKSGANIVTAQVESFVNSGHILEFIDFVKSNKTLVGLAIEPNTEIDKIFPYIERLDLVLIMSVQTGKSGQKFDKNVIKKVEYLSNLKKDKKNNFLIEIDGGINEQTSKLVKVAGADIVVSGNFVYGSNNKKQTINLLK